MLEKELPRGWTQHVREHGLVEWVCPHGVGHPAPNEYQPQKWSKGYPGHGCDGCCAQYNSLRSSSGVAEKWTVRPIHNGYAIYEGEREIHRQFGHEIGLNNICDAHNAAIAQVEQRAQEQFNLVANHNANHAVEIVRLTTRAKEAEAGLTEEVQGHLSAAKKVRELEDRAKELQKIAYDVPLCADHAAAWFTARHFKEGDCWFCQLNERAEEAERKLKESVAISSFLLGENESTQKKEL